MTFQRADPDITDVAALQDRLAYLTAIVAAIRAGEVDGVVVGSNGEERVYTRTGAEQIYRRLVERLADGIVIVTTDGTLLYANRGFAAIVGMPLARISGRRLREFVRPGERSGLDSLLDTTESSLASVDLTMPRVNADDVPVRLSAAPLPDSEPAALCIAVTDLSGPVRQAKALARANDALQQQAVALTESSRRFRTVFEQGPLPMAMLDAQGLYMGTNAAMCALVGRDNDEICGQAAGALTHDDDRARYVAAFTAIERRSDREHLDQRYVTADGEILWVSTTLGAVRASDGSLLYCLEMTEDITARKRAEDRLRYLAERDQLTGLANRHMFNEALVHHLELVSRYPVAGALLLVDLDNFKDINDALGHPAGDRVLQLVAECLNRECRAGDVIARLGGDEFALLLPFAVEADARAIADRLRRAIGAIALTGLRAGATTASIGVRMIEDDSRAPDDLLAEGDAALYLAKESGRNRVGVYGPDRAGPWLAERRLYGAPWVRQVIADDRLALWFQPVRDLRDGSTHFHEALLRIDLGADGVNHPQTPAALLAAAERSGLMTAVDEWVIENAIAALVANVGLRLSINLSVLALQDHGVIKDLLAALGAARVDPSRVVVEVTERVAATRLEEIQSAAARLHEAGSTLALDDFGSGYSSFMHLKQLPVDYLKLDGSFISGLPASTQDKLMVGAMVDVAHGLGQLVIAEWVETEAQIQSVLELGVDCIQGYCVGRPAPAPIGH